MNREIKFRAWDKENGRLLYGQEGPFNYQDGWVASDVEIANYMFKDEHYIWQQYTGLKDKNGREIYEGDIIRTVSDYDNGWKSDHYDFTGEVVWADDWAGWVQKSYGPIGSILDGSTTIEVIGSVYENPELLEDL